MISHFFLNVMGSAPSPQVLWFLLLVKYWLPKKPRKTYLPLPHIVLEAIIQLLLRGIIIFLKIMRHSAEPDLDQNIT